MALLTVKGPYFHPKRGNKEKIFLKKRKTKTILFNLPFEYILLLAFPYQILRST